MARQGFEVGKYLTNIGVLGAAAGVVSTARRTSNMPRDWRRFIVWGVWIAGLVLAISSVAMQDRDEEFEEL
ncbi:hypothetical protein [Leucobacter sp. G161]|uniref:hypothetical protein n=1 Tax=Leucobacter sp. G161 TaxID=663704 RepID=UPI00073BE93B|nr:hypothetical protein [Leucobacter sp. G161]KUF08163.1 hypothetical protein AUL38_05370 [Leucobacter sp. G161]